MALSASVSSPTTISALTFAYGTYGSMKMDYVMIEASTSARRQGSFMVSTDGTNVGFADSYVESVVLGNGISLTAAVSGSNIVIQYSGTGTNAVTMRAQISQFAA
jgi:hypothetical protein